MKNACFEKSLLAFTLVSTMLLVACSNREVSVTKHEGPIVGDETASAPRLASVDRDALEKLDTSAINLGLSARKVGNGKQLGQSESIEILRRLEPFVLNRAYLDEPRVVSTTQMRSALSAFMGTLTELATLNADAAAPWIEKARVAIESGCDGKGHGCTNISFFRTDGNSSKVMQLSAAELNAQLDTTEAAIAKATEKSQKEKLEDERDGLIRLYYRRLNIAFDLRNATFDQEFEFMYLTRARSYADAFEHSKDSARERDLLLQHSEKFEMILNRFDPDLSSPQFRAKFEAFVNAFSPWSFSRENSNPFGTAATRMLSLAAKNFMYEGAGGNLSSSLRKSIEKSQKLSDKSCDEQRKGAAERKKAEKASPSNDPPKSSLDESFAIITENLKCQEPELWANLELSDSFPRDEYFFMIDRVYNGDLTPDDASELFRGSHRNGPALLQATEKYIKIQLSGQIVRTNEYMNWIYSLKDASAATLFQNAILKSNGLETQWKQMLSRIGRVQLFIDRNLKVSDDTFSSKEYKNVNEMLTSLQRNIKYVSVYPNMMLMVYFMAEVKGEIPIVTYFGSYKIDAASIITEFFDVGMKPLFNFGNDSVALKRIETLYAFLFALKTEAFKTFDIAVPKFFEVVLAKYLESDRLALEDSVESIRRTMRQSNNMSVFLGFCRQDRDFLSKSLKPGRQGTTLAIELANLTYGTYVGTPGGYGIDALGFYSDDLVNKVRSLNENLRRKLDFIQIMVGLYEKHIAGSVTKPEDRAALSARVEKTLAPVKKLRREYLTEVTRWNKELSSCIDQSVKIEIDRQNDLMDLEIRHLRDVWKAMTKLRTANTPANVAQANAWLHSTLGLKDGASASKYAPFGTISAGEYVYAELDILLRMRQHLKIAAPVVRILMPADIMETSYVRDPKMSAIAYSSNEEDFVRAALMNFNDSQTAYLLWLNNTARASVFSNRIGLLAELNKLGKFEVYDTNALACQGKANITECPLDKSFEIKADNVVSEALNAISLLSMSEPGGKMKRDASMVQLLGSTSRWPKSALINFTLDSNGDPASPLESLYKLYTDDETPLNEGREYNTTAQSVGHFLFAPAADSENIIKNGYVPLVTRHFDRVRALEEAIQTREKADGKSGKIIDYSYETRLGELQKVRIENAGGNPVYLARQKIDDFSTKKIIFHRETINRFKVD